MLLQTHTFFPLFCHISREPSKVQKWYGPWIQHHEMD